MKKTYLLIGSGFLIIAVAIFAKFFYFSNDSTTNSFLAQIPSPSITQSQNVNYKAYFAIYTNGIKRIFTNSMYHNLSENVYIDASNPSIVHVNKPGITWMDFFLTLPMKVEKNCLVTGTKETFCTSQNATLKFYLNGVRNDSLLTTEIKDGDAILISYGEESLEQIKSQLNSVASLSTLQNPQ